MTTPGRPSIPTSIDGLRHSFVSECSLMTYSEEKAELVKEAFFQRLRQCNNIDIRALSIEQKEALLRQVQSEQEEIFTKRKREERRKRRNDAEKRDFFDRLNSLRLKEEQQQQQYGNGSKRRLSQEDEDGESDDDDDDDVDVDLIIDKMKVLEAEVCATREEAKLRASSTSDHSAQNNLKRRDEKPKRNSDLLTSSFGSIRTIKHINFQRTGSMPTTTVVQDAELMEEKAVAISPRKFGRQRSDGTAVISCGDQEAPQQQVGHIVWPQEQETKESLLPVVASTFINQVCINDLIDLKIQSTNQQATIDTLSTKLHNLELANRQQAATETSRCNNLTKQLIECRERELSLTRELTLRHMHLDKSTREQRLLEGRNRDLEKENSELRHMLQELQIVQCINTGGGDSGDSLVKSQVVSSGQLVTSSIGGLCVRKNGGVTTSSTGRQNSMNGSRHSATSDSRQNSMTTPTTLSLSIDGEFSTAKTL